MNKKEQILEAALRLFVEHGFHGTPTSRVAQEASVSNGTLFNYFSTKEELVIALYNQVKHDMSAYLLLDIDPNASIEILFRTILIKSIYWALDHPKAFFYIQQFNFSPHLTKLSTDVLLEQNRMHREFIGRGIAEGVFKPLPTDLIYSMVNSQIFGLFQYLMAQPMTDAERHQTIQQSVDLLWNMVSI